MRNIISISVPSSVKKSVDSIMKENKYASVSEFFRDAIRSWEEEQIIKEIRESQAEIARGEGKILKSLADLD